MASLTETPKHLPQNLFFTMYSVAHREITLIELQSLVVFGCTALLFMVGATASTHDRKRGGIISYLCLQNRAINRIQTYNHAAWASNSGEEKDSLDHSATDHFI